jgi:hypothetical protein
LRDAAVRGLEAFEVWCFRRMMRISRVDGVTKEEAFRKMERKEVCGRTWLREEMK